MPLLLSLLLLISFESYACPKGYTEYSGDCIEEEEDIPKTVKEYLQFFGEEVTEPGAVADLFAPNVSLFENPTLNSAILFAWKKPDANIESVAKIEKVLHNFYEVTVTIYDGPTSCGMSAAVKKTLHGYIPKITEQGLPTLWKYRHMTGLC